MIFPLFRLNLNIFMLPLSAMRLRVISIHFKLTFLLNNFAHFIFLKIFSISGIKEDSLLLRNFSRSFKFFALRGYWNLFFGEFKLHKSLNLILINSNYLRSWSFNVEFFFFYLSQRFEHCYQSRSPSFIFFDFLIDILVLSSEFLIVSWSIFTHLRFFILKQSFSWDVHIWVEWSVKIRILVNLVKMLSFIIILEAWIHSLMLSNV